MRRKYLGCHRVLERALPRELDEVSSALNLFLLPARLLEAEASFTRKVHKNSFHMAFEVAYVKCYSCGRMRIFRFFCDENSSWKILVLVFPRCENSINSTSLATFLLPKENVENSSRN